MTSPRRKKIKLKKWLAKSPRNIVRYMDKLDVLIERRKAERIKAGYRLYYVKYNTNGSWVRQNSSTVVTDADFEAFFARYMGIGEP